MLPIASLLACAPDVPADTSAPWMPPDAPGAWAAGTWEDSFVGSTGQELDVQVWYPAAAGGGEAYAYDDMIEGSATGDATPACEGTRPVVLFSHGHSAMRWQSIFLTERLATHGFVVVAPDHAHNTAFDMDEDRLGEVMLRRPVDVRDAFDWLTEVAAGPGGPLEGCVDPAAGYAATGQSFGGYTTHATSGAVLDAAASAELCATSDEWLCGVVAEQAAAAGTDTFDLSDDRVWAAVPMTPAGYEAVLGGLAQVQVPLLMLGGGRDVLTPMETQVRPAFQALTSVSPRYLAVLADAGHFTFSNACDWLTIYEECNPPFLPTAEAYPVIDTVVTAFLRDVGGDPDVGPWLPPEGVEGFTWEVLPPSP